MQRSFDSIFEHKTGAEVNYCTAFMETGQLSKEMCIGFHGITDHNPWHLQYAADYSRIGLEKRSTSNSLFTVSHFLNVMENSHFPNSDSMVDFTAIPTTLGSGNNRSGKRKLCFTDDTRSVRPCTSLRQTRFARILGGTRVDPLNQVLISAPFSTVCGWPHYSDGIILPPHLDSLCPMQNKIPCQNRERSSTLPFLTWRSGRMMQSECMSESGGNVGLSNNFSENQLNGLSSAAKSGCQAFPRACFIHPSFIETLRDFNMESYVGAYARRYNVNGAETFSATGRMLNSFDPSRRFMFYRAGRHSPFRESVIHTSQPTPFEEFETLSRLTSETEVAMVGNNSPYVPVHGRGISSSISYNYGNGNAIPRSAPSRRPRRRRRQRLIHRQRSSHELLNQSLENEEADIDSPQSDADTDIDEMSYEELLVLEERIGNVETGLSKDSIEKCLKMGKHCALSGPSVTSQKNEVLCSICQEEFRENDELALLVCGHSHHPACIKQWLQLKNQCPICKAPAYLEC